MAVSYRYACPICGHYDVEHPFGEAPRVDGCPDCGREASRVIAANLQFSYGGRAAFHDGPMGDGATVRETADSWRESAKSRGIQVESTSRWV